MHAQRQDPTTSGGGVSATLANDALAANPDVDAVTVAQPISVDGGIKVAV